ncbi:UrcA family protein [Sphingomonas sp. BN140010]|uniref:UrcA family protein n=1 Tax=Sphingomonas arvum TaxID=2992113 RepID=A0ABT3JGJ5_9SPHN|nr:UrcA family protein [Sphingomonas sp. BN140010]MCW3797860.1 UrcA family protein [Sphingomonas sp. BN140010]
MTIRSAFAAATVSLAGAAAALAIALPAPAHAAMPGAVEIAAVSTADIDLASPHGQAMLKSRLQRAAAEVCGEASSVDPAGRRWIKNCRAETFGKAWNRAQARLATPERLVSR